ncbi:hypothetical protein H7J50_23050 [Mycobacterium intermedium]|uniref:hypothetical protein n=1 Tax=Mycobacterium intermedium TaxID=28445 RepID=UPI00084835F6|nr:hypothetical protein [Mycobacterium intermedium]MCV6966659.1 hypothetical protein [Mycobacterium intermedium]ODR00822.1 hypothetical protein BHQ20_11580 [Mycobacterium intermedium]OPE52141.1 hypothetical protein BV508_03705 [Mycobacterium intermedium]
MSTEAVREKRVTLNVDLLEVADLLERVPRACVAFAGEEGPRVEPVTVVCNGDGRYFVGLPSSTANRLGVHTEVVLLVDDGVQFFDLRAVYVRGVVEPPNGMTVLADGFFWFEVEPTRTAAWDYARMREVDDES